MRLALVLLTLQTMISYTARISKGGAKMAVGKEIEYMHIVRNAVKSINLYSVRPLHSITKYRYHPVKMHADKLFVTGLKY